MEICFDRRVECNWSKSKMVFDSITKASAQDKCQLDL